MPRTGVDYADYNITVYRYCPYQCLYCYVWRNKLFANRVMRGKYDPVVEAERIAKKSKCGEKIVVSFTSDPYPFEEAWMNLTRGVIFTLRKHSCATIMVLTKNPILALKDRDVMLTHIVGSKHYVETWLGTTITSTDLIVPFSMVIEPNVPRTELRLRALREYQKQGGYVWISLEPIIPIFHPAFLPSSLVLKVIKALDTDKIKLVVLGRLNYIKQINKYMHGKLPDEKTATQFYRNFVPEAIDILKEHGIPYHVKKELAKVLEQ